MSYFSYYFSVSILRARSRCRVNKHNITLYLPSFEHRYAKNMGLNKGMTNTSSAHTTVFPHCESYMDYMYVHTHFTPRNSSEGQTSLNISREPITNSLTF